jgi:hypothetical protein
MRKIFAALMVVLAFALMATSCSAHVTGGGFIDGKVDGTASFGFNFQCDGFDDAKGQFTYHDADSDLKIRGTFTHCTYLPTLKAWGPYVGQGKSDYVGGDFVISGSDNGEPGDEDFFKIALVDDEAAFYWNYGHLGGGNIQGH